MLSSPQSALILIYFVDMAIMLGVGGRLLYAASRTQRTAEAAIGASATFGALGVILSLSATTLLARDPSAFPLWAAGRVAHSIGVCALAIGCWRVYRPAEPWAAACAAIACSLAVSALAIRTLMGSIAPPIDATLGPILSSAAAIFVYAWAAAESLHYHRMLRLRLALGLADPVIAHQFLLWGVSGLGALSSSAINAVFTFGLGRSVSEVPIMFAATQLSLFFAALCLWFAFFPPQFYRARLTGRATTS